MVTMIEALCALEWWRARGEKTEERLHRLVDHFLDNGLVRDPHTREAAHRQALDDRKPWEM